MAIEEEKMPFVKDLAAGGMCVFSYIDRAVFLLWFLSFDSVIHEARFESPLGGR